MAVNAGKIERIYFGHPINTYKTSIEAILIKTIKQNFPNAEIINPADEVHQKGFQTWKKITGNGMVYFFEKVLQLVDSGIFLPFRDKKIGHGVFSEARFLKNGGRSIYEIDLEGQISQMTLDTSRVLSIEDTRERIKKPY